MNMKESHEKSYFTKQELDWDKFTGMDNLPEDWEILPQQTFKSAIKNRK